MTSRMQLLDDNLTLLAFPVFFLGRFGFFLVDALAAGFYERCFLNCNGYFPPPLLPPPMFPPNTPPNPPYRPPSMPPYTPALPPPPMFPPIEPPSSPPPPPDIPLIAPPKQCDGLLAAIVAINLFSICAFALVVGVRWVAPERSYSEACRVTYLLVALDLTLKVADAALPIVLVATCFPKSFAPPFNSSMVAYNCDVPCALGDLYAAYGFYGFAKTAVGIADIVVLTPFLCSKPKDWYRWGSAYAASRLK